MFRKKIRDLINPSKNSPEDHITIIVDESCEFEGKLSFRGTARIAGKFRGDILKSDHLIVGPNAKIHAGIIEVKSIIVSGEVVGNIVAREKVEMLKPAVFRGNVITPSLHIEEGVVFEGKTHMDKSKQAALLPYNKTKLIQ